MSAQASKKVEHEKIVAKLIESKYNNEYLDNINDNKLVELIYSLIVDGKPSHNIELQLYHVSNPGLLAYYTAIHYEIKKKYLYNLKFQEKYGSTQEVLLHSSDCIDINGTPSEIEEMQIKQKAKWKAQIYNEVDLIQIDNEITTFYKIAIQNNIVNSYNNYGLFLHNNGHQNEALRYFIKGAELKDPYSIANVVRFVLRKKDSTTGILNCYNILQTLNTPDSIINYIILLKEEEINDVKNKMNKGEKNSGYNYNNRDKIVKSCNTLVELVCLDNISVKKYGYLVKTMLYNTLIYLAHETNSNILTRGKVKDEYMTTAIKYFDSNDINNLFRIIL